MSRVRSLSLGASVLLVACGAQDAILDPRLNRAEQSAAGRAETASYDIPSVIYDESIDGDLMGAIEGAIWRGIKVPAYGGVSATAGLGQRLDLQVGVNLVKGSTFYSTQFPQFDLDGFTVEVPRGMELRLDRSAYGFSDLTQSGAGVAHLSVFVSVRSSRPEAADPARGSVQGNRRGGPPVEELWLGTEELPQIVNGVEGESPLSVSMYRVVNNSLDLNQPVRSLPAGRYTFGFGSSVSPRGDAKATWQYVLTLVMLPLE